MAAAATAELRPGPNEDFYKHVNFEWLQTAVIPPEYSTWGSFMALRDESLNNQIILLKEIANKEADLSIDEAKLKVLWKASLKRFEDWSNNVGSYTPIEDGLTVISKHLDSASDALLAQYLAYSRKNGLSAPFYFYSSPSVEDSNNVILNLYPYGLSLPSRDYYFDEKFEEKRAMFIQHLNNVAAIVGESRLVPDFAAAVVRFENKLAKITMKSDQARQRSKYYTITTLDSLASGINELKSFDEKLENYPADERELVVDEPTCVRINQFLEDYYKELKLRETLDANYSANYPSGTDNHYRINVNDGDYFRRVFTLLFDPANKDDLKAYLQYKLIRSASDYCTVALNEEVFDFYNRKLGGQKEQQNSEKRSVEYVNSNVGFLLGQVYVNRYFSIRDKERVSNMIGEVADVMKSSIERNDWLTADTKVAAYAKLARFTPKIGFPDKWKSYDKLVFNDASSLWELNQSVNQFTFLSEFLEKLNSPVDTTEWGMTPQTVNAYFHPLKNEIVFPAAIIQPPFYSSTIDKVDFELDAADRTLAGDDELVLDAVNFGGIAAVIAHEITHGFDDQGRKYDHNGNMNDWWCPEDASLFQAKCDVMAKQTWTFLEPATGKTHTMNPKLCMGENLADLGGISLAVQALNRRIEKRIGEDSARRSALYRIFFYNWAVVWKAKLTDDAIVSRIATDPHAPAPFRGNLVQNIDQFYDAFEVKPGDGMFLAPQDRVVMW